MKMFLLLEVINIHTNIPDTQAATMIFNIKNGTFKRSKDLNYKRWYGSAVRTGDEKLIILGGKMSHRKKFYSRNN